MTTKAAKQFSPNQGPQGAEFKELLTRPKFAWPTIAWFFGTLIIWTLSTVAGWQHWWPLWASVLLNGVMVFSFFTVIHDSSHRAVSTVNWVNELFGRMSAWFYGPLTIFTLKGFRYLHMQHHLHTNEPKDDPDYWCSANNKLFLVLSWATIDLHYIYYYAKHWNDRPKAERRGFIRHFLVNWAIFGLLMYLGYGWEALFFWAIPGRIGIFILAFSLDYLPHAPYKVLQKDNPFLATRIRVGQEWLLTPLLMHHNYHLVHHLYPLAPFYRYRKIWLQGEEFFLENHSAIVSPLGREISIEEYREKVQAKHNHPVSSS